MTIDRAIPGSWFFVLGSWNQEPETRNQERSGLFDFRKDTVTPSLKIDDKLLSDILSELYPPKSPYEFSVIANSVHSSWSIVPGTEDRKPGTKNRELGTDEVIRLTAGHQAKVEERTKSPVPTRAPDGPSAPRRLCATVSEPRPALTEAR